MCRNFYLDKRPNESSDLRCPTLVSFLPHFLSLPLLLVEATPPLANIISSFRSCGNLCETMELLESVIWLIRCLAVPQQYNKKPRWTKSQSLNGSSNKFCRASLLTNNRKKNRPYRANMIVAGWNTWTNHWRYWQWRSEKENLKNPKFDGQYSHLL